MSEDQTARLYLVSPRVLDPRVFSESLARLLDDFEIACVRLALATSSEDDLAHAADVLREVCHTRDVPLVVADHFRLAERLGLDGVHLGDGSRTVRAARQALGKDAIVGAWCQASRHDGMTAGEIGADYVSFGPLATTGLGTGDIAPPELFEWWSELIEVPVVAEGGVTPALFAGLREVADFIALGDELWLHPDGPDAALRALTGAR